MNSILLALFVASQQSSPSMDKSLLNCREIEDQVQRVACYDDVVDTMLPAADPGVTDAADNAVSKVEAEVPSPKSLFGTTAGEAKRIVEASMDIEEITSLTTTVSDVQEQKGRGSIIYLENGQVWRRLDKQRLRIKAGDEVIIRKASLGSFLLEKSAGSRSVRVKRVR